MDRRIASTNTKGIALIKDGCIMNDIGDTDNGFNFRMDANVNEDYNYEGNISEVRIWNKKK